MQYAARLAILLNALSMLIAPCGVALAQSAAIQADRRIQVELLKKYPAGTVLAIRKPGLVGASPCGAVPTADYKDGQLHRPGKASIFAINMLKCVTRDLPAGWKVDLAGIGANVKNAKVTVVVIECDACNNAGMSESYRGAVSFQFPKGSLDPGSLGAVEDAIAQVFAVDASTPTQSVPALPPIVDQPEQPAVAAPAPTIGPVYVSATNAANRLLLNADGSALLLRDGQPLNGTYAVNGASVTIHLTESNTDLSATADGAQIVINGETWLQPGGAPATAGQPMPTTSSTTNIGDTIDQVTSRLGTPDQVLNAGTKLIYLYKGLSLKITFVDGRVSSID